MTSGKSHHFFRTRRKRQSSETIDSLLMWQSISDFEKTYPIPAIRAKIFRIGEMIKPIHTENIGMFGTF